MSVHRKHVHFVGDSGHCGPTPRLIEHVDRAAATERSGVYAKLSQVAVTTPALKDRELGPQQEGTPPWTPMQRLTSSDPIERVRYGSSPVIAGDGSGGAESFCAKGPIPTRRP